MFYKISFVLLSLCYIGNSQVFFSGKCPTSIKLQPEFEVTRYLGKWYEYAKYPAVFQPNGKCTTATYEAKADGTVNVYNTQVDKDTNVPDAINGTATLVENAKLKVSFPVAPAINVESNYWVLSTDYKNYTVVYSCREVTMEGIEGHNLIVWILTRERFPSVYTLAGATNVLQNRHISLLNLETTIQYGCEAENN